MSRPPVPPDLRHLKVRLIEIKTFIHATEADHKVLAPLSQWLGESEPEHPLGVDLDHCTGTHGQQITTVVVSLTKSREIKAFFTNTAPLLTAASKQALAEGLGPRVNEKFRLYLRFDKQRAIGGELALVTHSDVFQVIIAFYNKDPTHQLALDEIRAYLQQRGYLPSGSDSGEAE